jgi:integrase
VSDQRAEPPTSIRQSRYGRNKAARNLSSSLLKSGVPAEFFLQLMMHGWGRAAIRRSRSLWKSPRSESDFDAYLHRHRIQPRRVKRRGCWQRSRSSVLGTIRCFLTALRTGLREGELAALRWGDIQFEEKEHDPDRYILALQSYDRRWSKKLVTTKSRTPRRIDMSRELRRELLKLRDQSLLRAFAQGRSDISADLVFCSEAGTVLEMNNVAERIFTPLLARAGLRNVRFHDLRHTFGSLLIQAGHHWPTCATNWGTARFRSLWTFTAT